MCFFIIKIWAEGIDNVQKKKFESYIFANFLLLASF